MPRFADQLIASGSTYSDTDHAVIVDPTLEDVARSLSDTNKVLF